MNKKIVQIFNEMADLLEIRGTAFKPAAYRRAADSLANLKQNVSMIYKVSGLKGIKKIPGVGDSMARKIEECVKRGKVQELEKLREETAIQQIIAHYFKTKGISLSQLKYSAKKKKIIYSRFTRPAKQLLILAGSVKEAKKAINVVSKWALSRDLDYTIETVFKRWLELDRLKPKEVVKKPYYKGNQMWWSEAKKLWYVINEQGEFLEFAGKETDIEWRIIK